MASIVAGLFVPPAVGRGAGGGVGDHFCCSQRRPSPPREQHLASVLTSKVNRYCRAVQARRENLGAVDSFYRELIACQWRLDAIEAQQRAVRAEAAPAEKAEAGGEEGPRASEEEELLSRRQAAVDTCLQELADQRDAAIEALEERASHYALASGDKARRFAAGAAERHQALQSYRELAGEVCTEASAEMRGLMEAPLDQGWLRNLGLSLERRLRFWTQELEETWVAWHDATARMHNAGHDAMGAWREIAEVLESACQHFEGLKDGGREVVSKPELQSALVAFPARSLEVELVNSFGLSGLRDGDASNPERDQFCVEIRLNMLTAVLDLLSHLGVLDRVGEEILTSGAGAAPQQGQATGMPTPTSRAAARMARRLEVLPLARPDFEDCRGGDFSPSHCEERPGSPSLLSSALRSVSHPSAAVALRWATVAQVTPSTALRMAASSDDLQALGHGRRSASVLLPWLIESIVLAVCAAQDVESREAPPERSLFSLWSAPVPGASPKLTAASLLESCRSLGNGDFAEAVRIAVERRRKAGREEAEAESSCACAAPRTLQQVTQGLSSSCARLLDLDGLSDEACEDCEPCNPQSPKSPGRLKEKA